MRCPGCNVEVEPGDVYCYWCGRVLSPAPETSVAGSDSGSAGSLPDTFIAGIMVVAIGLLWLLGLSQLANVRDPGVQLSLGLGLSIVAGIAVTGVLLGSRSGRQASVNEPGRITAEQGGDRETALVVSRMRASDQPRAPSALRLWQRGRIIFGPTDGSLPHDDEDDAVKIRAAGVVVADFVAGVTFYNPYDLREGDWTYGLGFRVTADAAYRLVLCPHRLARPMGRWELQLVTGRGDAGRFKSLDAGPAEPLRLEADAANEVVVVAHGARGELFINSRHIATLDLSAHRRAGDLWVGTGLTAGTEITGRVTRYKNFAVQELPVCPP